MQQINLYTDEFRPKREWLTFSQSLTATGASLAILLALYLLGARDLASIESNAVRLENTHTELKKKTEDLKRKPAADTKNKIEEQIAQLRLAITNRKKIEILMSGKSMGNRSGFSTYVAGISSAAPANFQLDLFEIQNGGRVVNFSGAALDGEKIPLFVQQLKQNPVFDNTSFGAMHIEKKQNHLRFTFGLDEKTGEWVSN